MFPLSNCFKAFYWTVSSRFECFVTKLVLNFIKRPSSNMRPSRISAPLKSPKIKYAPRAIIRINTIYIFTEEKPGVNQNALRIGQPVKLKIF